MMTYHDPSNAWLQAISDASICLQTDRSQYGIEMMIDESFTVLESLEKVLLTYEAEWDNPPTVFPPPGIIPSSNHAAAVPDLAPQIRPVNPSMTNPLLNGNRFATFQNGEESSDEDEEEDLDDGGDVPILNHVPFTLKSDGISMRRLMIRIVTAQSEMLSKRGSLYRYPQPRWVQVVDFYTLSLFRIQGALILADSEMSRLLEINSSHNVDLQKDANIVDVALGYLTSECAAFQRAAELAKDRLLKKLQRLWAARDAAKNALGDRWMNNPRPRNQHTLNRKRDEEELKEIDEALLKMLAMDTDKAREEVNRLKSRVQDRPASRKKKSKKPKIHRYNGLRPEDTTNRVSWELYPDPTNYGWKFTGSHKSAEFFEKENVRLDWYFTTATMKTSMKHPKKGSTQMFGARVSPELYVKILINPREHTGVRYRTKANKKQF